MSDKQEQQERLREAVDRKAAEAESASHEGGAGPGDVPPREEGEPRDQASPSPREHGSRHGQVTADKWNQ